MVVVGRQMEDRVMKETLTAVGLVVLLIIAGDRPIRLVSVDGVRRCRVRRCRVRRCRVRVDRRGRVTLSGTGTWEKGGWKKLASCLAQVLLPKKTLLRK
jgi:hypothetical protein